MLLAGFLFATMNVFVKLVPNIPAIELVFFRSIISLIISASLLRVQNVPLFGTHRRYLLLRGLTGAVALVSYFYLIQKIPLASATVLQFLSPIFTTIFGIFILREKVFKPQWLFFLIAFIGIVIIRGFDPRISTPYVLLGIIASIFSGLAYNFIRKIRTREHPLVIILYFPLVTVPITGLISLFIWKTPQGIEWVYILAIGLLTQAAQYFMTRSYQYEEVSKVASIRYVSIIYALSYGYILFKESFNLLTYVGMVLVLAGVIANIAYKSYRMRRS